MGSLPRPLYNKKTALLAVYQLLYGAGDGNRTHATSLEGWSSTIELHPQLCPQK